MSTRALVLTLEGALRSWGSSSYGDHRSTEAFPQLSAVAGMVAAAMGIDRSDTDVIDWWCLQWDLASLSADIDPNTKATSSHYPALQLNDFQTIDRPIRMDGQRSEFRQVGYRSYLMDRLDVVALIAGPGIPLEMFDDIDRALRSPAFTPYIGRRCCPLSRPPWDGDAPLWFEFEQGAELVDHMRSCAQKRYPIKNAAVVLPASLTLDHGNAQTIGHFVHRDRRRSRRAVYGNRKLTRYELTCSQSIDG